MSKSFDDEIRQLSRNENEIPSDVEISRLSNPGEFYKLYVADELIESILEQTVWYNEWRNTNRSKRKVKETNKDDIRAVIGIILYMGIIKLPNRKMYWSSKTRVDFIASSQYQLISLMKLILCCTLTIITTYQIGIVCYITNVLRYNLQ